MKELEGEMETPSISKEPHIPDSIKNNYERIQILAREKLPIFNSLEFRTSFNLMKKSLV